MTKSAQRFRGTRRGFTVIEILIASVITAVIAGLMLAVVGNVLTSWNRSHGWLTAEARARIVLDQLSEDLAGALYRNDGNVWLTASIRGASNGSAKPAPDSSYVTTPDLSEARFGAGGMTLRFFTAQLGGSPPAPEAVGYVIALQNISPSADSERHYQLFRSRVDPSEVLAAGYSIDAGEYAALGTPAMVSLIADNVVDFGVRLYARDPADGSLVLLYPAHAAGTYRAKSPPEDLAANDRFPEVADVMVRLLTDDGARRIQALESGKSSGDWWTIAVANSRVFTRRVELHPGRL